MVDQTFLEAGHQEPLLSSGLIPGLAVIHTSRRRRAVQCAGARHQDELLLRSTRATSWT